MSSMEYNKGILIPTNIDLENYSEDDIETLCENGIYVIDGEAYKVQWIKRSEEPPAVLNVTENEDGSISFETYHYNGGAHWTEVVEEGLRK